MTKFTHITMFTYIADRRQGATPATLYDPATLYGSVRPCRHDSLQNRTWTGSLPALAGGASR